jgi:hypothetical protein
VVNVVVAELAALERFLSDGAADSEQAAGGARVHHLPARDARPGSEDQALDAREGQGDADVGSSMRAAAPPMQSFGMGRRR